MLAGNFTPQFPVELIEKDFGYVLREVGGPEAAPTIAAARGVFQRAIEHGLGGDNMTGVVRLSAGDGMTCAVRDDGTLMCWGSFPFKDPEPSALHPTLYSFY